MVHSTQIRFGILGTASIARAFIGVSFEHSELSAIASRDLNKAHAFADEANIPKRYGSYEALLDDPDIDAVYIPLPQHLHCEYTIKAAQAKKHVLVEKPCALSLTELKRMDAACKEQGVLFMEGFMYRFRSVHIRAKQMVKDGTIGELRFLNFSWAHNFLARAFEGFRLQKELGGGCLLDLGVYGVDWIRFITDGDPKLLNAFVKRADTGLDIFAHAVYKVDGAVATMTAGYNTDANFYLLSGEKGSIYSPIALSGRVIPGVLQVHLLGTDRRYTEEFPAENTYVIEMEYFATCIKERWQPFLDADNAMKNFRLIEEINHSAIPL